MDTNQNIVTMDAEEMRLLDLYEKEFGETPPVAFLDPKTSKKLVRQALKAKRPFSEDDLPSDSE